MQGLAYQAYGDIQQRTASEKEIEHALMVQITGDLEELSKNASPLPSEWTDPISRNLQMWTIFASDALNPNNPFPDELKRQILFLSEFVRQTSLALFAAGKGDLLDLIGINKIIMDVEKPRTSNLTEVR